MITTPENGLEFGPSSWVKMFLICCQSFEKHQLQLIDPIACYPKHTGRRVDVDHEKSSAISGLSPSVGGGGGVEDVLSGESSLSCR